MVKSMLIYNHTRATVHKKGKLKMKKQVVLNHFKRFSKFAKFVRNHINKKVGRALIDWNRDMLDKHYYGCWL